MPGAGCSMIAMHFRLGALVRIRDTATSFLTRNMGEISLVTTHTHTLTLHQATHKVKRWPAWAPRLCRPRLSKEKIPRRLRWTWTTRQRSQWKRKKRIPLRKCRLRKLVIFQVQGDWLQGNRNTLFLMRIEMKRKCSVMFLRIKSKKTFLVDL